MVAIVLIEQGGTDITQSLLGVCGADIICSLLNEMTQFSYVVRRKKINIASTNALTERRGLHLHFIRGLFLLPSCFIKVLLILKLLIHSSGDTSY